MVVVPPATPVTRPVDETVATAGVEDVHGFEDAGVGEPVNCVVAPAHTTRLPVIVGSGFTVTALVVLEQPVVVDVNVNVADPADTPVTTPAFVTVATAALLLVHVPPVVGLSVIVFPIQTAEGALTTGNGFTVIVTVCVAPVQPFEDVGVIV
jgi:hypothetical protein